MDTVTLQLNRIQYPVNSLGPGKRFGIWTQGCSIHCDGCVSKSLWDFKGGKKLPVKTLAEIISQLDTSIEGVSITGGEPFDQYNSLMAFCSYLKALGGPPIQIFTGYKLQQIEENHPDRIYAEVVDALVEGPYVFSQNGKDFWRGSTNQNYYVFENEVAQKLEYPHNKGHWALNSTPEGEHFLAGIPGPDTLSNLERYLERSGLCVRFDK